ncbi:MAG: hypothetical protein ABI406_04210, partial [Ktedonobacteraceae bacterium]
MRFSHLRQLEIKLGLGFGLLFLCMVGILGANFVVTTRYEAITANLINHLYPARQQVRGIAILQLSLDSIGARYVLSYDPQQQTQLLKTYQQEVQELRTAIATANTLADTPVQRIALSDFTQYFFGYGGYYASNQEIFAQKQAGQLLGASDAYAQSPILSTVQQDINTYIGVIDGEIAQAQADELANARLNQIL